MKKIIILSLALAFSTGIFSACGCSSNDVLPDPVMSSMPTDDSSTAIDSPEDLDDKGNNSDDKPAVSKNKEVVSDEQAPKVYMIKDPKTNVDRLTYHLNDCPKCEGKDVNEASWDMVKSVGFWQCPECNPPRYEGYKNAE